ncbi:MAG: DEAD/DEAH box helicase family protein, partial [Puniceicoccales bacterium]|nr:DEAD/DEAH box helicase family protein [Puniceicoccales bacterium]
MRSPKIATGTAARPALAPPVAPAFPRPQMSTAAVPKIPSVFSSAPHSPAPRSPLTIPSLPPAGFQLVSDYQPAGDQPEAIEALEKSLRAGNKYQTLLGVTGSGKTFTMANLIARLQRPALIISHNKTLAAQLYSEFRIFFPHNAVEYFISYYDYYQPEAYIPQTDTYIEKDSAINDDIERLRIAASSALLSRRDVIVVASVSCIYGLGSPEDFKEMMIPLRPGMPMRRDTLLEKLAANLYQRNETTFDRCDFRVRGDIVDIFPAYKENALRVEFWGDEIEALRELDPLTGRAGDRLDRFDLYPATQYIVSPERLAAARVAIAAELETRVAEFERAGRLLEAQRIRARTEYDLEMLAETGMCQGIENYSMHIGARSPGQRPCCLLDFFPPDTLVFLDESHVTFPQIAGMSHGDRSRKQRLVEFGFRLPSALENRPLRPDEFAAATGQTLFVSATPAKTELDLSATVAEQIIRPTGLLDPVMEVRPIGIKPQPTRALTKAECKQVFRDFGSVLNAATGRVATFATSSVGKIMRHKGFETARIFPRLSELYRSAIPMFEEPEIFREGHTPHPDVKAYHHFLNRFAFEGRDYFIRFTLREEKSHTGNGANYVHSTFVSPASNYEIAGGLPQPAPVIDREEAEMPPAQDSKLSAWLADVNPTKANSLTRLPAQQLTSPRIGQVEDFIEEAKRAAAAGERVLCTTLTKRMSEDLAEFMRENGLRVEYLHSDIDAIERVEILRRLREGRFDVLIGVNLLREGLDLPEVALVGILDADKEGFLRSETSLIQTAGRAARHERGRVILYADEMTDSLARALAITALRRERQMAYNTAHGITPRGVARPVQQSLLPNAAGDPAEETADRLAASLLREGTDDAADTAAVLADLERDMLAAADALEFERAALLRDQIEILKGNKP